MQDGGAPVSPDRRRHGPKGAQGGQAHDVAEDAEQDGLAFLNALEQARFFRGADAERRADQ